MSLPLIDDLPRLTALNIHDPAQGPPSPAQVAHRVDLVRRGWQIDLEGCSVFEVGCGQGDMTSVLAVAVGEGGSVTGCDPASLDYGELS